MSLIRSKKERAQEKHKNKGQHKGSAAQRSAAPLLAAPPEPTWITAGAAKQVLSQPKAALHLGQRSLGGWDGSKPQLLFYQKDSVPFPTPLLSL